MSETPIVHVDADLEDLVPIFLQRRRDEVAMLLERLSAGEFDMIRIMGHTLKGTAGGYGFEQLSQIGASIEKAAQQQDTATIKGCADEMQDFLARVRIQYR